MSKMQVWKNLGFLCTAFLLQLPLVLNPGYFSHDELQWLALADTDSLAAVPWIPWTDFAPFQYRPLTFNLWLLLAHFFGYQPTLMHASHALLGSINSLLLWHCLLRLGAKTSHASIGALVFLFLPFVTYTHGWVGTLADVLCLMWLLLAVLWLLRATPTSVSQRSLSIICALFLTGLALLTKEWAIVFPVLLLTAAYRVPLRNLAPAILASGSAVVVYLALRLDIILFAPRTPGAYAWSINNIPANLLDYMTFAFLPNLFETLAVRTVDWTLLGAGLAGAAVMVVAALSAGWRWALALTLGWMAALGPVLILSYSSNLYSYVAAAFVCGLFALAYPRINIWLKGALFFVAAVAVLHGIIVEYQMRHIGRAQQHLYADLMPLVATAVPGETITIKAVGIADEYILLRLLFGLRSYQRVPLLDKVAVLSHNDDNRPATHLMLHSGHLIPNR